ncbi:MAG: elongation factor P [Bdellovibrionales bacterium]|jgi:elongation factor P|nr:elongation factor P [Bdellovibrionales bacterium]
MYQLQDFKKGLKVLVDGEPFTITDFQHVKPGKGNQFTRCKARSLLTGQNREWTFKQGEKFEVPDISTQEMQFLYKDDSGYTFMNQTNYEQVSLNDDDVGEAKNFLIENLDCVIMFFNGKTIGVDVPNSVQLKVVKTDPSFKGNTVTGAQKPATLETGFVVHVPMHISEGDVLKVDTRTGDYVERVNK